MSISEIMEKYTAGEIDITQANEELKAAGATFHLNPLTDEERAAKKQREDAEGFFDPAEHGLQRKEMPTLKRPDMKRRTDLAGQTVRQRTRIGQFDVIYDEDGYAVRAKKV